ncbi:MAG: ATPase [Parcubacteria group bacterium]|nr:ATPase [Parcubacteria group bacterium]
MTQDQALSILATGVNVFLTGEPGSGKTHTVNTYVAWLRARGVEPAITASTGIAATHIHGMTIHSWSGIGIRDFLSEADIDAIAAKEHVVRRIQKTTTLIIDEISMLSANVLVMVDAVCREVKRVAEPFGGIQVVLVGDFFQLPPIGKRDAGNAAFAFESTVWQDLNAVVCYLTEQHRQEDKRFLSVLGSIRAADADPSTVSAIMNREADMEGFDEDIPRLFTHNADVDKLNQDKLDKLATEAKSYRMLGTGAPPMIEALKRGCLSPEALVLKEGAIVMGTKNIPALGLANGTLGTVIGFERGTNYPMIETNDGRTITVAPVEWAVEEGGKARATITQVPLRLAWAITVHKSQGMSMDAAAIDLSRAFEYGQGYVALSRVRSLAGLHILGWSESALMVHPLVASRDEGFRELSEAAEVSFTALDESGERLELEKNFIRASGGEWEVKTGTDGKIIPNARASKKKPVGSTYDDTLALLLDGKSLAEAALTRGLTFGTICAHAEKLTQAGRIPYATIEAAIDDTLRKSLPDIHKKFKSNGIESLTPTFESFKGRYSFDELRLARLVYTQAG